MTDYAGRYCPLSSPAAGNDSREITTNWTVRQPLGLVEMLAIVSPFLSLAFPLPLPPGQRPQAPSVHLSRDYGLLDMRAQAEVPSALRADTSTHLALADVSDAPKTVTRTQRGVSDRRAQQHRLGSRDKEAGATVSVPFGAAVYSV